ncbi:MAG: phosphomannomutase/phosphoglucomutase, partial [Omnitrophica WOR_2 bacterium]
ENSCDVGIIFDGDADRVMFVDEKGKFIQPDLMIAVLADYYSGKGYKGRCLQDIRTSKSVTEYVESKGFEMDIWRVGRAYAALKLREIDGLFGGELAGHYYFREFYYSDSAYLAALLLLGEIQKAKLKNIPLSLLINNISNYFGSGEINLQIENKQGAIGVLVKEIKKCELPTKIIDFDGYRLEFTDWWFNIRPSNTEPYLRLIIEAKTPILLEQKLNAIMKILQPFISPHSHGH